MDQLRPIPREREEIIMQNFVDGDTFWVRIENGKVEKIQQLQQHKKGLM
ncbi:hypothetical protein [Algoriphagus sp. NG3]|nr:hypothetical protein [Algoriphagus sp. NG3]WPR77947.1 hypothetical protein SLW71_11385 [Algoriphagus sp. NG3]